MCAQEKQLNLHCFYIYCIVIFGLIFGVSIVVFSLQVLVLALAALSSDPALPGPYKEAYCYFHSVSLLLGSLKSRFDCTNTCGKMSTKMRKTVYLCPVL